MVGAVGIYTFLGMCVVISALLYYCIKKFGE